MAHPDQQKKWDSFSTDMRTWNPPLNDPTKIGIPISAAARIRFEPNSRDAINSRIWESLKYDTKSPNTTDIQNSVSPVFQDSKPINSRTSEKNYYETQQAQFFPDKSSQSPGLVNNPFLQRLDATQDSRNIIREIRSAVNEDNRDRQIDASKVLAERQFSHRFLPDEEAEKISVLKAFELLRSKPDDYNKMYRPE